VFLWNEYRNFKWVPLKLYSWQTHTHKITTLNLLTSLH
jgi:hypothetical protein